MRVTRFMAIAAGMFLGATMAAGPALGQEAATKPPVVSHDLAGREQCMMCHKAGVMEAVPDAPASHKEFQNESCMVCHSKDSPIQSATPKVIPHDLAGREQCLMCHTAGVMEAVPDMPASHGDTKVEYCALCHKAAG